MGLTRNGDTGYATQPGGESRGGPLKSRLLASFFLVFCCAHAVFLAVSIIPAPPARDDPGHPVVDLYRLALGGRQQWNLFDTIPVLHSMDVRLEGVDEAGTRITAGCVLPGFRPYPQPEDSRYYVLFVRLLFFDNRVAYRDAYFQKVAELLSAQRGTRAGVKWSLIADTAQTRNLFHSRRDGQLSLPASQSFPLPVAEGNSP